MKLIDIYKAGIKFGMKNDPRGEAEVKQSLKREKENYESLKGREKEFYDRERLTNPYSDSRIIYNSGKNVKNVMMGIDMEGAELLLADRMIQKGKKVDAVIAHHPSGRGFAGLHDVMSMQADIFGRFGVNIGLAQGLTEKRAKEVHEKIMPVNHYRHYDVARLLGISLMNFHTPADNCVEKYLQSLFDKEKPETVGDIMEMLYKEPEYAEYAERGVPPAVLLGNKSRKVKKVFVDMTGGTEGAKELFKKLADAGVDTVVGMHFSADHKKAMSEAGMNAVIAGHISSDTLGMNLLFDMIEKELSLLNITGLSGFIRVKRTKKKKK